MKNTLHIFYIKKCKTNVCACQLLEKKSRSIEFSKLFFPLINQTHLISLEIWVCKDKILKWFLFLRKVPRYGQSSSTTWEEWLSRLERNVKINISLLTKLMYLKSLSHIYEKVRPCFHIIFILDLCISISWFVKVHV